jgi:hypothetical protein
MDYKSKLNESFTMQQQMDDEMIKNYSLKQKHHDKD